MPTVKPLDTKLAEELGKVSAEWAQTRDRLEDVTARRDKLIRKAASRGYSLRAIADVTGLTRGRIQQILKAK